MHPELFTFDLPFGRGRLPIRSYGAMLLVGVVAAFLLARRLSRKSGIGVSHIENLVLVNVLFGVLGARFFFFLFYSKPQTVWDLFKVWEGGLVFYGGVLLAAIASVAYIRIKGLPLGQMADIIAPCLALGLAFGRVGCFLNGCCWGDICMEHSALQQRLMAHYASLAREGHKAAEGSVESAQTGCSCCRLGYAGWDAHEQGISNPRATLYQIQSVPEISGDAMPLAVRFPVDSFAARQHWDMGLIGEEAVRSLPVHPVQLYESALSVGLCVALVLAIRRRRHAGEVFAALVVGYGALRFWTEIFRADNALIYCGMSISQLVSLCSATAFAAIFAWRRLAGSAKGQPR